ncbi:hypothetical protein AB3S75_000244 [Citrus x aurantiifolia]
MGWLRATGNGDKDSSNRRGRSLGHGGNLAEPVVQVDVTNHQNCEPTIKDNVLDKLTENSSCVSGGGCFNAMGSAYKIVDSHITVHSKDGLHPGETRVLPNSLPHIHVSDTAASHATQNAFVTYAQKESMADPRAKAKQSFSLTARSNEGADLNFLSKKLVESPHASKFNLVLNSMVLDEDMILQTQYGRSATGF